MSWFLRGSEGTGLHNITRRQASKHTSNQANKQAEMERATML